MGETQIIAPLSQLLQPPLVVSGLEAIGNYHTIWAGIYGCLNSVEKLRPVSPTHNNEEMDVPLGSQPKKELTSTSLFITLLMAYHHEWSQSYIKGLTFEEHHVNNEWFNNMLTMLKDDGELYVPMLNKSFNKSGEEVSS